MKYGKLLFFVLLITSLFIVFSFTSQEVGAKVKSIAYKTNQKEISIGLKESRTLKVRVTPKKCGKDIIYKSNKPKTVSVTKKGKIKGKKTGVASIYAKSKEFPKKKARIKVRVLRRVNKIKLLNSKKKRTVKKNSVFTIQTAIIPKKASKKELKWSTSSSQIATVDKNGVVITKNEGTALIKASATDGSKKSVTCKLKVVTPVQSLKLSSKRSNNYIEKGTELKIKVSYTPSNASNKSVTWKSSKADVAKVDNSGRVYGIKEGTAKVTAKAKDGSGAKAEVVVTVISISKTATNFIAHRGLSSMAPENTIAAFELAIQYGFEAVECDIWETADGEFAVSHDNSLFRATEVNANITELTMEEIKQYKIISGNGIGTYPNESIPSLREYLDLISSYENIRPIIELKMEFTEESLERIIELVSSYELDNVVYISFHKENLKRIREKMPETELQYLVGKADMNVEDIDFCIEAEIDVSFQSGKLTLEQSEKLKAGGRKIGVWTVNDVYKAYEYINQYHVDFLTSDYVLYEL